MVQFITDDNYTTDEPCTQITEILGATAVPLLPEGEVNGNLVSKQEKIPRKYM